MVRRIFHKLGKYVSRIFLLFVVLAAVLPVCLADNITFSLDQKEFFFKTGDPAVIVLHSDNSYDNPITGTLSNTMTQHIVQSGFQFSSSNSQSASLTVSKGKGDIPIGFGSSDDPSVLDVNMRFQYTDDDGDAMEVAIDGVKIHFVSEDSQKEKNQEKVSSSSQKVQSPQQGAQQGGQQADPLAQQEQKMQQMMNQMLGNQQNNQQGAPQGAQQKLQNNQMSQDSSALKKQMQQQVEEQQKMKDEFQKNLAASKDFQEQHQDLLKKGYNITGGNMDPETNDTGSFELNYKNSDGEQASLKGHMQDGKLQDIQSDTPEQRQKMMDQLEQDSKFKDFQEQLQAKGFNRTDVDFSQGASGMNSTDIRVNYQNSKNESASIDAHMVNSTVDEVKMNMEDADKEHTSYWWFGALLLILAALVYLGYVLYNKYRRKPASEELLEKKTVKKPFDYKAEAKRLLEESEQMFDKGRHKDAYGKAGQAVRLYLAYKNSLGTEMTNDKLVSFLKRHHLPYKKVKECFDMCSLVEFAKYKANSKDFHMILKHAKTVIGS